MPLIPNSRMSVEMYRASLSSGWIGENNELLRGVVVEKPVKSPEHEYLVDLFLELIRSILPTGCFVAKERPITTSDSEPLIDVGWTASPSESDRLATADGLEVHPTRAN